MAASPSTTGSTLRVVTVVYPGAEVLDITGPLDVFDTASRLHGKTVSPDSTALYQTMIVAERVGPVAVTAGLKLHAEKSFGDFTDPIDTLILPGAIDVAEAFRPALLGWLRQMSTRVERIVGVCSGALILAEAGLLDGRRATTHWESCPRLARYPGLTVEPDAIFVQDGNIFTSAGITAGMDLALSLVEADHGAALALATAQELVMYVRRSGGQSQFSPHLKAQHAEGSEFRELVEWCLANLDEDLSVTALARRSAMSTRNFARAFARDVGVTPAKYIEAARVEAARGYLEHGDDSLDAIASACGFRRAETMRRSFKRQIGVLPTHYRQHFRFSRTNVSQTRSEFEARTQGDRPALDVLGRKEQAS